MRRIAVRFALIVFILTVAWTFMEHFLGYNTTNHEVGQYTRMAMPLVYYGAVAFAVWWLRDQQNNTLSFAQGMKVGALTAGIYSLLVTGWFALYAEVINKQYQPTLLTFVREKLTACGTGAAEIEKQVTRARLQSGGSVQSYLLLFTSFFVFGLVVSAIASLIMQKKPKSVRLQSA